MKMKRTASCAIAILSLCAALCSAAPKIEIRVIQRARPDPSPSEAAGPIPLRAPADPTGPFSDYGTASGCISNSAIELDGQRVWIDLCHLKNVTFIETPITSLEVAATEGSSSGATAEEGSPAASPAPVRKILGIFRGWKIDPIYKKYKYAIFDDGDLCGDYGERYSVAVELVRSAQVDAPPRIYDLQKVSSGCAFTLRVEAFVQDYELNAYNGIHTPGVLDISDANEMLPQICGEMKCQYSHVSTKVDIVKNEIQSVQHFLKEMATGDATSVSTLTLSAASSIIKSATNIMEKALELLQTIEQLEQAAQDARALAAAASVVENTQETATS